MTLFTGESGVNVDDCGNPGISGTSVKPSCFQSRNNRLLRFCCDCPDLRYRSVRFCYEAVFGNQQAAQKNETEMKGG